MLCCGDLVGYGPNPGEAIAMIRELNATCVRGNHDHATALGPRPGMVEDAAKVIISGGMVTPETQTRLKGLVMHAKADGPSDAAEKPKFSLKSDDAAA